MTVSHFDLFLQNVLKPVFQNLTGWSVSTPHIPLAKLTDDWHELTEHPNFDYPTDVKRALRNYFNANQSDTRSYRFRTDATSVTVQFTHFLIKIRCRFLHGYHNYDGCIT